MWLCWRQHYYIVSLCNSFSSQTPLFQTTLVRLPMAKDYCSDFTGGFAINYLLLSNSAFQPLNEILLPSTHVSGGCENVTREEMDSCELRTHSSFFSFSFFIFSWNTVAWLGCFLKCRQRTVNISGLNSSLRNSQIFICLYITLDRKFGIKSFSALC